jgi:hypothetical protein
VNGWTSPVGWKSHCSVATMPQPPAAFMPRMAIMLSGNMRPMPLQCGA